METTLDVNGRSHTSASSVEAFRMLLVVATAQSSRVLELMDGAELIVGRSEPADLVVPDPSVSREHVRLRREGDVVRVFDLGSRNGTWVSGQRVSEAVVPIGGALALGTASICVQLAQAPRAVQLGLMSPIAVLSELEQECVRSRTFDRPLSVMVARPVRRGSISGSQLSARCLSVLRASDRAGLYDRGALLLVLPEMDAGAAERVATQLVHNADDGSEAVSVACGIASIARDRATGEQLVSAAFCALDSTNEQQPIALAAEARQVRGPSPEPMVRRNPSMLELARMVERLAPKRISVLVLGETGSGKELIARELHEKSDRSSGPLQIVNCGAIPEQLTASVLFGHVRGSFTGAHRDQEGVFAQADGGTIFLDEIGELSAEAQTMLLRVLDTQRLCPIGGKREQTVDVRVIAATHRNLAAMAEQGTFRLDLYHRLNSVVLRIPPLRDRKQEILPLAQHFLARFQGGANLSISDEAAARLLAYHWPGNVRELRNVIERAVALCETTLIREEDLPHHLVLADQRTPVSQDLREPEPEPAPQPAAATPLSVDSSLGLRRLLRQQEIDLIEAALHSTDGNQKRAADLLQIPLRTFERKLRVLGIRRNK